MKRSDPEGRVRIAAAVAIAAAGGLVPAVALAAPNRGGFAEAPEIDHPIPELTRPVEDWAERLSPSEEAELEQRLRGLRERTGVEMRVVVVGGRSGIAPFDQFAAAVAGKWAGRDQERDRRVLLVVAVDAGLMRLVVGAGLASAIPDSRALYSLSDLQMRSPHWAVTEAIDRVERMVSGVRRLWPGRILAYCLGVILGGLPLGLAFVVGRKTGLSLGTAGSAVVMVIGALGGMFLPVLAFGRPAAVVIASAGALAGFYLSAALRSAGRRRVLAPSASVGVVVLALSLVTTEDPHSLGSLYFGLFLANWIGQLLVWPAVCLGGDRAGRR